MPDNYVEVGTITINVGIDHNGIDVTELDIDGDMSILTILGALHVAAHDITNGVTHEEEP